MRAAARGCRPVASLCRPPVLARPRARPQRAQAARARVWHPGGAPAPCPAEQDTCQAPRRRTRPPSCQSGQRTSRGFAAALGSLALTPSPCAAASRAPGLDRGRARRAPGGKGGSNRRGCGRALQPSWSGVFWFWASLTCHENVSPFADEVRPAGRVARSKLARPTTAIVDRESLLKSRVPNCSNSRGVGRVSRAAHARAWAIEADPVARPRCRSCPREAPSQPLVRKPAVRGRRAGLAAASSQRRGPKPTSSCPGQRGGSLAQREPSASRPRSRLLGGEHCLRAPSPPAPSPGGRPVGAATRWSSARQRASAAQWRPPASQWLRGAQAVWCTAPEFAGGSVVARPRPSNPRRSLCHRARCCSRFVFCCCPQAAVRALEVRFAGAAPALPPSPRPRALGLGKGRPSSSGWSR